MRCRKIFLDTCVLSDIGRMTNTERKELSIKFNAEWNFQIVITAYNLIELEKWKEIEFRENVYDFLDNCFLGYASDFNKVFNSEINNLQVNIIEFSLFNAITTMLNFKEFKNKLFLNPPFLEAIKENDRVIVDLQEYMRNYEKENGFITDKQHIDIQILNYYAKNGKNGLKNLKIDYNKIPSIYTYYFSYVKKIKSSSFKENYNEFDDVSMSYLTPYIDIVIAERKQIARYTELKQCPDFKGIDNVIIKRHGDVIKNVNGHFLFQLDI